ncbi:RND superfamily putative drug exporter [Bacillus sp. SORGH_AS 510]|uniref:MMPL family transporter n=1 Tax=Bacillus sp. SORGH_AS_0510 TaxID=3041771 RepID=UPI002785BC15|nr:MMPL family transporter [Bacillus sp. SORGH_AS_0510]MDQ1147246.1 RND superfamily putative drug exporter [Bacillus sp. SORGH_AS_0510]
MEKKWIEKFGNTISGKKGRWIVLFAWLILATVLNVTLPQANSQKNEMAPNLAKDTWSEQANSVAEREFPSSSGTPALLTWYRSSGLTDNDISSIQKYTKDITENPVVSQDTVVPFYQFPLPVLKEQLSKDGTTLILPVTFKKGADKEKIAEGLEQLKEKSSSIFTTDPTKTKINDANNLVLRVTGPAGIAQDATELFSQGDLSLLFGTVAIVLVLLLLIYRSPILALIPLLGVGIAYGVISPILGGIGKAGWAVFDSQALSIMTVLLFGAGTDYCLFLISRFRSYLEVENDKRVAMIRSLKGSSGAIAMSGLTVVFSLLVLLLSRYGSIHRFAIPFSVSILIMMVASLTLIPALLSIFGRVSFFPLIPRTREMQEDRARKKGKTLKLKVKKEGFGLKLGNFIIKRPKLIMTATILFLGVFALFSTKIQYTYDTLSSFPKDMPSREGFNLISEHFNPGELAPVQVILQTDGKESSVKSELEKLSYVAHISEAKQGTMDENIISYNVEFNVNPYSNKAMDYIPDLRKKVEHIMKKDGVADPTKKVWIGGQTAEQYDTRLTTTDDAKVIIPIVIGIIALLLLVYLRSVTSMLYLILTVLLSYFSALGLGWAILHYLFDVDAIQGFIPLYSFVFIVALGEDYNIFMISSIWKKSKEMPLLQAIKEGVAESGAVITSAGLILAGTFAILTTLPIQVLVHFGTITAIGVLLDTFIVRPLLVPAITVLLGKWAFWPSKRNLLAVERNGEE